MIDKNIGLRIHWLTESDIRNKDKSKISFGGLNNGYNFRKKKYSFVYNEITGYAIDMYLNIYRWTKEVKYLQFAEESANYLLSLQCIDKGKEEYGAIPHSLSLPDLKKSNKYYSFDAATCLQGLMDLYEEKKDTKYLDSGVLLGNWLINKMQNEDGSFLSLYNARTNRLGSIGAFFEQDRGCLHAKHAIGLLKLAEMTNEKIYRERAKKVCNWVLTLQAENGAFWANIYRKYIFTHTHCYATEGLLYTYWILKDESYLKATKKSGEWLISIQNVDGSLYRDYKNNLSITRKTYSKFIPMKTTDATAQAVRIWIILYYLTGNNKYIQSSQKAIKFLKSMQCLNSKNSNMLGGFYYQCFDKFGKRWLTNTMYTWCTMFGVCALYSWGNFNRENRYDKVMKKLF